MNEREDQLRRLEAEIERRLLERFAALRDEFDRLRLESDRRWEGFLSRFDQDFGGVVPADLLPSPPPSAEPAPPSGRQISLSEARTLDEGENQVDVLRRFLELCGHHASRVVLFVARSGSLGAWRAIGFSERGGSDEAVRKVSLPLEGRVLPRVLAGTPIWLSSGNEVSRQIQASDASEAVLVPMVVREKISGLVYADCVDGEEERFHPDAIGLLTYIAGLAVDRLASRKLRPAPALADPETVRATPAEEYAEAEPEKPEDLPLAAEAQAQEAEAEAPSFASTPHLEEPAAPLPRVPVEDTAPRRESLSLAAPSQIEEPETEERAVSAELTPQAPEPAPPGMWRPATISGEAAASPSAGARRLAGPLAPVEGDERREEARRFARLLVSEIKLYNERAVFEGRQRGDLYQRLKEDIDRSRQMYDDRIPEDVRSNSNFFYEELVRILADGRSEALGL